MGSERKSKEEKKKKSRKRTPSSESEDERRSKRQRSDKKEKGKDKKSHKQRSDKEKKSKDKHRDKHHKRDHYSQHEFQELTNEDYFAKNNEFATWLKEEKKVFFSDLSSDSAREYFSDFIKAWNKQKLDSRYYEGISSGPRSAHNWKIKARSISTAAVPCLESQQERERRPTNHGSVSLPDHPNPEISCFYQKGFSQITREATGKALHGLCVKGLMSLGVFCNNTLINMYSKFGCAGAARHVFDEMRERNESSWNNMMSGLVRMRLYRETVGLFSEMLGFGVRPSGVLVASLLTGCGRSGYLVGEGVQVHGFTVKVGFLSDVFVATSLLHFYGTFGSVCSARRLFEEMPNRNVVSWTSLMVGYLDNGNPMQVMNLYRDMRCEDVDCNENTFATVITSCGLMENDLLGYQVLGHVIKFGLENNVSVANSLVSMLGSFGRVKEARSVFDSTPERDTISWNSMISVYVHSGLSDESLRCFLWMRHVHKEINTTTLSTLLSVSGSVDNLKWGRGIHGLVVKLGLHSDVCVCNTLLGMYSEAGRSEDAKFVFQGMPEKDSISWNSLIVCYIHDRKCLDALKIFSHMLLKQKIANYVSFTSALAACSDPEFVIQGKIVHALATLTGLHENLIVGNALLTMYAKSGMMVEAKQVFLMMPERNEVTWNALIGGHAENGEPDEAVKAYKLMREKGLPVDYITIANVLGACLAPGDLLKHGMPIHAHTVLTGFESNKYVQNSLITMYAKCGDLNSSIYIFDGLANKNSVSWNAMIAANAHHGHGEEILKLIAKMRRTGLELDQFSFSEGLAATAKLALFEEGQQLHGLAIKLGFDSDLFVTNAAMDMYGKCGEIDDVLRVSPQPMERARMSWNILTSVFARHGYYQKARETFHEMVKHVKPDRVTFISLLSACSHGGLMIRLTLPALKKMIKEAGYFSRIFVSIMILYVLLNIGRRKIRLSFMKEHIYLPEDHLKFVLLSDSRIQETIQRFRQATKKLPISQISRFSTWKGLFTLFATTEIVSPIQKQRFRYGMFNLNKLPRRTSKNLKRKRHSFKEEERERLSSQRRYCLLKYGKLIVYEVHFLGEISCLMAEEKEEVKTFVLTNMNLKCAVAFCGTATHSYITVIDFLILLVMAVKTKFI
ncbi:hypothetical protein JRO89_XSUnG0195300 [Xanthoceras sorbifolium]|uniref:Pentatricopeptide repeat-containing protein n=1 Tax=Xanthoceras sorbifolium TaxID=99658 RepID=A0ABQ8GZ64_9ROSI|nr:hypothetical protein JRO89_XSUnG0195300 [Xanthoceras sorbifolium]